MRNELSFPIAWLIFSVVLLSAVFGPVVARYFGAPRFTQPFLACYEAMVGLDTYISPTRYGNAVFDGDAWSDTIFVTIHDYNAPLDESGRNPSLGTVGSFPEADPFRRNKWPDEAYWSNDGSVFVVYAYPDGPRLYDFKRHTSEMPLDLQKFIESRGGKGPNLLADKWPRE